MQHSGKIGGMFSAEQISCRTGCVMKKKLVVIGAGFAGLQVVHGLKNADIDITLVDRRNHHLFQPLLYQVATTVLATSEIAWPIRHLFRDRAEVTTLLDEVVGIDRVHKTVRLRNSAELPYDILVLATGARHAYFGKDKWEAFAPGLKTLEDATTIRRRMLLAFEQAELEADPAKREALLTFAVIGAGPTGVEMAGMIAELAHHTLPREFRRIDTRQAKVLLVEAGARVLPSFSESLSDYVKTSLTKLGVTVRTGVPVTACDESGITIGEEPIACRTIVWAAGVQASPAAQWLGAESDRAGRVIVTKDLRLADDPSIFVIGDTASVKWGEDQSVPGIAPAAKQQGSFVAKCIRAMLKGEPLPEAFKYRHQGNLATIGRKVAVIEFGKFKLKGILAWWIWGLAHIYFLIGTRSRLAVAWSWLWIYLSGLQSARLITQKETMRDPDT